MLKIKDEIRYSLYFGLIFDYFHLVDSKIIKDSIIIKLVDILAKNQALDNIIKIKAYIILMMKLVIKYLEFFV